MPGDPIMGQSGGQHYGVALAIQTLLGQMAECAEKGESQWQ